jgi:hypothetical protein
MNDLTKFCLLCCFAIQTKFCKTDDEFHLVLCFAKLKKHVKLETLVAQCRIWWLSMGFGGSVWDLVAQYGIWWPNMGFDSSVWDVVSQYGI